MGMPWVRTIDEIAYNVPFKSHSDYIAAQPDGLRRRLEGIQQTVEQQVPGCVRVIRYNLPAFKQAKTFFYFAAFKNHIGIYPPITQNLGLIQETEVFRGPKGNLSFRHDKEFPLELIGRIAQALALQYGTQ